MVEMLLTARNIDFSIKNEVRSYRCLCSFLILFLMFLLFCTLCNSKSAANIILLDLFDLSLYYIV
jgi:hypothetical protein